MNISFESYFRFTVKLTFGLFASYFYVNLTQARVPEAEGASVQKMLPGWRDGSAVKSTDCSSKGSEVKSQQPHGGSQPSVMGSDALSWGG